MFLGLNVGFKLGADCRSANRILSKVKQYYFTSLIPFRPAFHAFQSFLGECLKHRWGMFETFGPYV